MSTRMASWASNKLGRRPDRRRFLTRTAIVGSALVTAPARFALRPGTAYAAVCSCNGRSCDCSSLCCDGYTEFCCTITGDNDCPKGSVVAGWWKADGSGYCDSGGPRPRYYLDCNASCGPGCGCGGSGVCASSCSSCGGRGGCANGSCGNRKSCVTRFRYGQCNNDVACVGPIICRVVTCTPPWTITKFDCNATVATDNRTASHHRACLLASDPTDADAGPVRLLTGTWTPRRVGPATFQDGIWRIRYTGTTGPADITLAFGRAGDIPVVGDWDGDGVDGIGVVRGGTTWYVRNSLTSGPAELSFTYGRAGDIPVVGDWDGDGIDEPGVVRDGARWLLKTTLAGGPADLDFVFGRPGDLPISGDWTGLGVDGPGVVRGGTDWYLRRTPTGGPADISFRYGRAGDTPVVGDWDANGVSGPGIVRSGVWYVRDSTSGGDAGATFTFPSVSGGPSPTTTTTTTTTEPVPTTYELGGGEG